MSSVDAREPYVARVASDLTCGSSQGTMPESLGPQTSVAWVGMITETSHHSKSDDRGGHASGEGRPYVLPCFLFEAWKFRGRIAS